LIVIEDACHALGAEFEGKRVGAIADMTVFSFHPVKHITTGEGGMVATNNPQFHKFLTALGENANYWPVCLPGSTHLLYFARSTQPENNAIYFARVDGTGTPVRVVSSLSSALFVPAADRRPGYLLWARDQDLLAQPFDAASGALSGQAVKIASGVLVDESQRGLMAAVSRNQTLVWASARATQMQFVWTDRTGRRLDVVPIQPGQVFNPRLSPDGSTLLFSRSERGRSDIWSLDVKSGATRRATVEAGYHEGPIWLPDGHGFLYNSAGSVKYGTLDGSAPPVVIHHAVADSIEASADGRLALLGLRTAKTGADLWAVEIAAPHTATELLSAPGELRDMCVSPDGRWLLWSSGESGVPETFLARFITGGGKPHLGAQRIPVSAGGGVPIGWRRDGREIVYADFKKNQLMSVPVALQAESATVGAPTRLFSFPTTPSNLAMAPDANRFIIPEMPFAKGQTLHVLTHWTARLAGDGR